jgi:hypothetical protein
MNESRSDLELLKAVAERGYEECEAEWKKLLRKLRLGLLYVVPIREVLRQARWRERANPMGYVRTAAVRTAVRMGLVDLRPRNSMEVRTADLGYRDWDGEEVEHDEKLGLALHEYREKHGLGVREFSRMAETLVAEEALEDGLDDVAWERVAEMAELDAGERLVVELRMVGFSRPAALAACLRDEDRRYLQASWRRFERHRETIKKVLKSGKRHAAQRLKANAGPELELMFMETPDNRLKIFFQRVVAGSEKGRIEGNRGAKKIW